MSGGSKVPDLDKEAGTGLRWTLMPVRWSALEPDGSVNLERDVPTAWRALDAFVIEAEKRRLHPCANDLKLVDFDSPSTLSARASSA